MAGLAHHERRPGNRARPMTTQPDPYVCATCGTRWVVPSLARECCGGAE